MDNKLIEQLVAKTILEEVLSNHELPSLEKIKKLTPKLLKIAQKVYDEWIPEDIDTYRLGGLCHILADKWVDKLSDNTNAQLMGIKTTDFSKKHIYCVIQVKEGTYSVDINPSLYEFLPGDKKPKGTDPFLMWVKKDNIKFKESDIVWKKISSDPFLYDEDFWEYGADASNDFYSSPEERLEIEKNRKKYLKKYKLSIQK